MGWSSNGVGPGPDPGPDPGVTGYPQVNIVGYNAGPTNKNFWANILVITGAVGYVEEQVQLPAPPIVLSLAVWLGSGSTGSALVSVIDGMGTEHMLDTLALENLPSGATPNPYAYNLDAFAGQNVKVRLSAITTSTSATTAEFDNVSISGVGGLNLLTNGDFEAGLAGWTVGPIGTVGGGGESYPQVFNVIDGYNNSWLRMLVGNRSVGYAEQQVQLASNPVVLSLEAWTAPMNSLQSPEPVTAIIFIIDEGGSAHVLDTFELATWPKTNIYGLAEFAGQNVKVRLSASASNGSAAVAIADFDNVAVSVPDFVLWTGGAGKWSDPAMWLPGPPSSHDKTVVPAFSSITVDSTNAQTGDLKLAQGSSLVIQSGAALVMGASAVNNGMLQIMNEGSLTWIPQVGGTSNGSTLVQNGTFEISSGGSAGVSTTTNAINGLVFMQTNGSTRVAGVLNCGNGTISLGGGTFDVTSTGNIGNLLQNSNNSLTLVQTNGRFTLNGGLTAGSTVLHGGSFSGSGNINGDLLADGGLLAPGLGGASLNIAGNFTQMKTSTLQLQVQGVGAGQFDQLRVGAVAQLGGALLVRQRPGFAPVVGDQLQLLSSSNLSGVFSSLSVPIGTTLAYSNNEVLLTVTNTLAFIVTTESLNPKFVGNNFLFSFNSVSNLSYTVVQNDDLASGTWTFYTNLIGTGEVIQMIVPVELFRQRFFSVSSP